MTNPLAIDSKITSLAMRDPRAAYWFLASSNKRPTAYPVRLTFDSTTPQQPQNVDFPTIGRDMLVTDMVYDVSRPEAFTGNIFKPQSDLANAKNPSILARLRTSGGFVQYLLGCEQLPIQELARHATSYGDDEWTKCWTLSWPETLTLEAYVVRTLAAEEVPYILDFTVRGYVLGCQQFGNMSRDEAIRKLAKDFGIVVGTPGAVDTSMRG